MAYSAWSTAFSNDLAEQTRVYVSMNEWRRIHEEQPSAHRIFGRIMIGDKDVFCALGEPKEMEHFGNERNNKCIIIPNWALNILGIDGMGQDVEITWLAEDSFPNATRVILRPEDSAFYHADAKDELERVLTTYGVIMEGTSIPISINWLGGFSVEMNIIKTYPANIVLLEGDEIVFEFEPALDTAPEPFVPVPAFPSYEPIPVALPEPVPVFPLPESTPPIPIAPPFAGLVGYRLGGSNPPPLPDGRLWNPWRQNS